MINRYKYLDKGNNMNKKHQFQTVYLFALVLLSLFTLGSANAQGIKQNDQQLMIKVDAQGCAMSVDLVSPEDNCAGSEFAGSCGKNGKDCVCMRPQKFLSWEIDTDARFELAFNGTNPLKANCKLKSGNNYKTRCKIEATAGDYYYDVTVEGCPGQVYDPKIVVR
ncbi:MAG: hypothetical protein ACJA13_001292 [Paraglaciecola sp.]